MSKKRALGKGLSALIGDNTMLDEIIEGTIKPNNDIKNIDIGKIIPKEDQPRKSFDDGSLKDLSKSIETHGVLQPILVRISGDKYEIIAGERRYRASRLARLENIPAIVMDVDSENAAKLALIENVQREDLNPIEEARAYKQLMSDFKLKHEELANAIGKSRAYISNSLRLLNLEDEVVAYLYSGQITSGHGKVLLGIKDPKEQINLAQRIINTGLNVRDTERQVKEVKEKKAKTRSRRTKIRQIDPYVKDLEEQLMRVLGTKVKLVTGDKVGKIEIEYYGEEDLSRIFELLTE